MAKQVGCACITKQYLIENAENDDPNTDNAYCSYKTAVNQFMQENQIKLFVDIHGLASNRESIIDICIDGGKNVNDMNCVYSLQEYVENKFGSNKCSIDKYYQAFAENIMSKWFYSSFNVSALELEINGAYRWFEGETAEQSLNLFFCLETWLNSICA